MEPGPVLYHQNSPLLSACTYVCMCVCVYARVCMYVCVYVCIYKCMYMCVDAYWYQVIVNIFARY